MVEWILIQEILKLSDGRKWEDAKQEWKLTGIYQSPVPKTCLCTHFPIKELCEIHNTHNQNTVIVGNCCVNHFMGINSNKLFGSIKRIKEGKSTSFNEGIVDIAFEKGIINDKEQEFYKNIWRKRNLTAKQQRWKDDINQKILNGKLW